MSATLQIILPVFLVTGFGYVAVWREWFSNDAVAGLMSFTQNFAVPCLLFQAISSLDLEQSFRPALLGSFYAGAFAGFLAGFFGARYLFGRSWEDCVAIGFCGLFSNSVLLGLPISERAYGADALGPNFAIISIHAPFCYMIGITAMEIAKARAQGTALSHLPAQVARAMFRNALIIGIGLGFAVNIGGFTLPTIVTDAAAMMARAALPAALFGLGGVLYRYRPEGDMRTIIYVVCVSLILHPVITYSMGRTFVLPVDELRAAAVTAAMAPGVNAYIFANMYGRAKRVAASAVLIATGLSVITTSLWLVVLP